MRNPISRFIESERFHPLTAVWTGVIISLAFFATVGFILLRTYYGMFQDETEIAQLQMLVNRIEQMNERRQEAFERLIIKGDSVELTNCLNEADDFWEHVDSVVAITEQDSLPLVISDIRNTREDLLTLEKQAKTQYASGNTLTALHSLNSHEYTYLNRALTQEIKQAEDLLTAQQWQSLASFRHRLILIAALGTLFTLLLAAAWLAVISGMKHYLDRSQSAELAQQESETKYRNLIESVPHAVLIFQKGCIAFANRGTAEMLGYSDPQQLIGTPLDKLIAPEDVERVLDYHRARIEHRSAPEHYTGTFLRNNGEGFTAEVFVRGVLYQGAPAFQALVMDVTERKLAEQSLRESEERFRSLADSAPVLIWMAGVDRHTYYFNKTWQRFTGRSVAKEYGRGWTEGVHANDLLRVLSTYKNAFEARRPFSIEFRLMHADGTYHWLLDTGAPRFTADGSFTGFIGSCVDITDRKRTDHEILKLSQAIEGLPESVVLTDVTGIIEYVNPAVIRLGGWNKASDVIGTSIFEYSDAAGRQRLQTAILPELMRAGSWHGDIEITLKNGNTIPSEVTAAIIPDETGQPAHLVASFRDISERKKAEAELQRERSQLLTLFDSIDEVIYVSDPQTHEILYINEACRKLIGDAVSKRCYSAIHNSAEPCAFCTNQRIFGSNIGQTQIWEHENGKTGRWFRCIDKAIRWTDGRMVRYEMAVDITDRKLAERETARRSAELEEINRDLEHFAYIASHDLQEPIRAMGGYAELLERRYASQLDQDARDFIGFICDGADRLREMIEDLLTYSRVRTRGKAFEPTDTEEVLQRALSDLNQSIDESRATVTHDPLPVVAADRAQLDLLLRNLLDNALKFHQETPLQIHLSVEENDQEWTFHVRDNGPGIDPRSFEQIFVIFKRLYGSDVPGTGAGLAVCKRIVERHGGKIWVDSKPGEGSVFHFTLPKHPLKPAAIGTATQSIA